MNEIKYITSSKMDTGGPLNIYRYIVSPMFCIRNNLYLYRLMDANDRDINVENKISPVFIFFKIFIN